MIAGLDGPIYVERVALFDARQRVRAGKAIEKAVRLQVEGRGFAFVEVLAECPTYLHLDPPAAEKFVEEQMVPVFPLGVKKDVPGLDRGVVAAPSYDPERVVSALGGTREVPPRFASGFPRGAFGPDIGLKLAGAGGDGAQTAAMLIAHAAIHEGFDATYIPSYGPESRGGTSHADVRVAEREVLSPAVPSPHVLVAFNAPSLAKFGPAVAPGGIVIYDRSAVAEAPRLDASVRVLGVPCGAIAQELGHAMVKNIVALGALSGATHLLPEATFLAAIRQAMGEKTALTLNEQAFARGVAAAVE
jgi:2-oxoisovalerate ferredoxin oxidoreductase beta subunit